MRTAWTACVLAGVALPATGFGGAHQIRAPRGVARAPDGSIWFTEPGNAVGRITQAGRVPILRRSRMYHPEGITAGLDGSVWFTNLFGPTIGRITRRGVVTIFRHRGISHPEGIAAGPGGTVWFTNSDGGGAIGRITTDGDVSAFRG